MWNADYFLFFSQKGLALEKMDDLFGVTELVKSLDDEETASNDGGHLEEKKTGARAEQIEVTQEAK